MKKSYLICIFAVLISQGAGMSFAAQVDQKEWDHRQAHTTVNQVLSVLDQNYVYPNVAAKMRTFVSKQLSNGIYNDSISRKALIEKLQIDLRGVSQDGHLSLHLATETNDRTSVVRPISDIDREVRFNIIADDDKQDIGYLGFNRFMGDEQTKHALINAMNELTNTKALIIDLRENIGGDPNLVAFLSSYFVDQGTILWSIIDRDSKSILDVASTEPANRYTGNLCILTSQKTYSAAEAFSYTLKHLGRACIVGETTGGGGHLVDMMRVNDDIDIRIPVVRVYNPITKLNWEGVGVVPTIETNASEAQEVAITHLKEL